MTDIPKPKTGASVPLSPEIAVPARPLTSPARTLCLARWRSAARRIRLAAGEACSGGDRPDRKLRLRSLRRLSRSLAACPYASRDYAYRHQPAAWEFIAYDAQYADMPHQHWLLAVAGSRPIVCEVSDITSQHVAARTGIGVAGLPCFLGDTDPALERLPFDGDAFSREIWLVVHADLKHSASIRTVTDFIVDSVSKSDLGSDLL